MSLRLRTLSIGLALGALLAVISAGASALALEDLERFPKSALEIRTPAGRNWFNIWIADTEARSEQGLMFVRALPRDQGMLFPQTQPRVLSMWMRNTLIPLDMLFIAADGRIVYIRELATPQSDEIITTAQPVKAVLELAGGEVAKRHIAVGDRVLHALFAKSTSASH